MRYEQWDPDLQALDSSGAAWAVPMTEPRTAAGRAPTADERIRVLNRMKHKEWCGWGEWRKGDCICEAGRVLMDLIAAERAEAAEPATLDALDIRALDYALPDGISYLAKEQVQKTRKGMVNWIADRYVAEAKRLAAGDKGSDR